MEPDWGIPIVKAIDCQSLLIYHTIPHSSWLRKQSFRNRQQIIICRWPQVFVVLSGGCMYYYRNETARAPAGSFSLYGYNVVKRATDVLPSIAPWAFRIEHTHNEYKTYLFSASSELEMKEWMKQVKKEMRMANKKNIRTEADGGDGDYADIETTIYDDPAKFVIPDNYKIKKNDDFTDDAKLFQHRAPIPPPVPSRDEACAPGPSPTVKVTYQMEKKVALIKPATPPKPKTSTLGRERPEGASIKKKTQEPTTSHHKVVGGGSFDEEYDDIDPVTYWGSIYFKGSESQKASDIIRLLAEDGAYLVRNSSNAVADEKVLVVYADTLPRKFKMEKNDQRKWFLTTKRVSAFRTVEELMLYYYDNSLPGYEDVTLTTPFQLHPKFKKSMF